MPGRHEPREGAATGGGFVHASAVVSTAQLSGSCVVHEHASVGPEVVLGDEVTVGPGARLLGTARIEHGATIGANATVCSGVSVGRRADVEPGSVVQHDVPPFAVVRGSPARIVDYVDAVPSAVEHVVDGPDADAAATGIAGVSLLRLAHASDLRGSLAAAEFAALPFTPTRIFAVYDVPDESVRGAHAHRECGQVLVCVSGAVSCVVDDGSNRQAIRLQRPDVGLYVPPLTWGMQHRYTADAVLLVLAELPYDPDDYIRDYEEFLSLVSAR